MKFVTPFSFAAALLVMGNVAFAQAPAPTVQPKPAKAVMSDADKKAKSADCSKQADTKNLHGKERKKFRETCKKS